jgi:hypothetical protein
VFWCARVRAWLLRVCVCVRMLTQDLKGVGRTGDMVRGRVEPVLRRLVQFDGNVPHRTESFQGERFAAVLFR